LRAEYEKLHKAVLAIVREDAICLTLMTVPDGRRQAARFKAGEGCLGAQDRSDPAPHAGRWHNLQVD
jgi:hypothetical protein